MMKKINVIIGMLIVIPALLISCKPNQNSSVTETDYAGMFIKTAIPLEVEFQLTSNIQLYDGRLYFCGLIEKENDYQTNIIEISIEDFSIQYSDLPVNISPNLIAVTENRYIFIASNFNATTFTSTYEMYITDKNSNIIFNKQISEILTTHGNQYDQICVGAASDKIYLAKNNKCAVIDENGKTIKTFDLSGNADSIQIDSVENVYIIIKNNNGGITMDIINIKTDKLENGDIYFDDLNKIKGDAYYIGANNNIYIRNETSLVSYDFGTRKANKILNWVNSGLFAEGINNIFPIDTDKFILYGLDVIKNKNVFMGLEKAPEGSVQEKTIIKVSYMEDGTNIIPMAAIKYNNISFEYQVVCEEYRTTSDIQNYEQLLSAYDADLLTGNIGDVLIMSNETDYRKYAVKGVFCDIYEIIENDETFSLNTLYSCVKTPYEIDGKLYIIIPEFVINTLVSKTKNLPTDTWNIKTMLEFIKTLPNEAKFIEGMTKSSMLNTFLLAGSSDFIDMENGVCSFDSEEFISLLEYVKLFPEKITNEVDTQDIIPYLNDEVYLYEAARFGSFLNYLELRARFGFDEKIEMIGYPSKSGGAAEIIPMKYYAVSNKSEHKTGAWEFIKYLISGETIINEMTGMRYIPSSCETFRDWFASEGLLTYYFPYGSLKYRVYIDSIDEEKMKGNGHIIKINDEFINEIDTFINSISNRSDVPVEVKRILREEIDIFLTGNRTAKETAKVIQNRVNIYVNEIR